MYNYINDEYSFLAYCIGSGDIQVPTLCLQAHDDPAFSDKTRDIVPLTALQSNENILYVETEKGGHFGYVEVRHKKKV